VRHMIEGVLEIPSSAQLCFHPSWNLSSAAFGGTEGTYVKDLSYSGHVLRLPA
jgi:hypothetical protein